MTPTPKVKARHELISPPDLDKMLSDAEAMIKKLRGDIRDMRSEAKAYLAYKQFILTASKSNLSPKTVLAGLKFAAQCVRTGDWDLVTRVAGVSGDLEARGSCPRCDINLAGPNLQPREHTLPCGIVGCPFERDKEPIPLEQGVI